MQQREGCVQQREDGVTAVLRRCDGGVRAAWRKCSTGAGPGRHEGCGLRREGGVAAERSVY